MDHGDTARSFSVSRSQCLTWWFSEQWMIIWRSALNRAAVEVIALLHKKRAFFGFSLFCFRTNCRRLTRPVITRRTSEQNFLTTPAQMRVAERIRVSLETLDQNRRPIIWQIYCPSFGQKLFLRHPESSSEMSNATLSKNVNIIDMYEYCGAYCC